MNFFKVLQNFVCLTLIGQTTRIIANEPLNNTKTNALVNFQEVSLADAKAEWDLLGSQFISTSDLWPICEVGVKDGKLSINFRNISDAEAKGYQPQAVKFSTDMTRFNDKFVSPTFMMKVDDDWLCAYSSGGFENSCWLFSKSGVVKKLLTHDLVFSLHSKKGRFFITTFDKKVQKSKLSEIIINNDSIMMKPIFEIAGVALNLLSSPDDETIYVLSEKQLFRWNMLDHTSVNISLNSSFFTYIAADAYSVCAVNGNYWIGGRGFVCSLSPLEPDLSIHLFTIKE